MKKIIILPLLLLLLSGCGKNKPVEPQENEFNLIDMPLSIGSTWIYQRYDEFNPNLYDTIVVTLTDFVVGDPNGTTYKLEIQSPNNPPQEMYWPVHHDSLMFSLSDSPMLPVLFPLNNNKKWLNLDGNDTVVVSHDDVQITDNKIYMSALKVKGTFPAFDGTGTIVLWLWRNLGIIKMEFVSHPLDTEHIVRWELIDYQPYPTSNLFTKWDYPLILNSYWYYQINDRKNDNIYDIKAEIVGYGSLTDSLNGYFMEYTYPDRVDTEFIFNNGDTLNFVEVDQIYIINKSIVFPLEIGKTWTTYPLGNTSEVLSKGYYNTLTQFFYNVYEIQDNFSCGDECGREEHSWYAPKIGLVKRTIYSAEYYLTPDSVIVHQDEEWNLKTYFIPPPDDYVHY